MRGAKRTLMTGRADVSFGPRLPLHQKSLAYAARWPNVGDGLRSDGRRDADKPAIRAQVLEQIET